MFLRSTRIAFQQYTKRPHTIKRAHHFVRRYTTTTDEPEAQHPKTILQMVENAADLLPNQGILENFVHHNPLEHFQSMNFVKALEHVHKLEEYMSPGERVFNITSIDPRKKVNEALVDLCSAFLDRGAAKWAPRFRHKGFLYFFASLETLGFAPWRKYARKTSKKILEKLEKGESPESVAQSVLEEHLVFFGIPKEDWPHAIRAMMLELRGWAGMFWRMETHTDEAPLNTNVRLVEFCAVQCIFSRASLERIARGSTCWNGKESFAQWLSKAPTLREPNHEQHLHPSAIALGNQCPEAREALETEYMNSILHAIGTKHIPKREDRPKLQLFTCIDDRECSFRRHVEETDPEGIETFGVAGFFGVPIRYKPMDQNDETEQTILAPEGQHPSAILIEEECKEEHEMTIKFNRRRKFLAKVTSFWERAAFSPIGSLAMTWLFPFSIARLLMMGFSPSLKQKIKEKFLKTVLSQPHTDFQLPFSPDNAAALLSRVFNDIGISKRFAPTVIILGHGSNSVNNPFAAAYNCGACGGRHGGPNARLFARLGNNKEVRRILSKEYSINIPEDTVFVGGLHNTTAETIEFFDLETLPEFAKATFQSIQSTIIEASLGKNALERCDRFMLAHVKTPEEALHHVRNRAVDAAEVRPELNHATNAAVVIGRRDLTKGRFLDRRVFLPSYDPFSDDNNGTNLEHVLAPALVVCSGINLEYFFSTIDVDHHGAGTKVPLNVVGHVGVLQGTSGDLRPGLPSQMTEMHTPIRALFIIDAPIDRVEAVLARRKDLRDLVRNEWVRMIVKNPEDGLFYKQSNGEYALTTVKAEAPDFVPFTPYKNYALSVAHREDLFYWAAGASMILSSVIPICLLGAQAMNPYGAIIGACGTMLSLPVLAFARRYLHGEFMFVRFSILTVGLVLGFNLVCVSPTLAFTVGGWSLFGFASTFLIGAYNERPTVRNNAIFAFAAYKISDFALIAATTFNALAPTPQHHAIVAGSLILAAIFKSSQFPLTSLFVRSMEGPTPASALGYAGLSAHFGVVLLSSTYPLWYGDDWARISLATIGIITAIYGTITSKVRSDRKGAIAKATSATLGLIFTTLALGFPGTALLMSLGHASYRMIQILRSPNWLMESKSLRHILGVPLQSTVPDWLYRFCWTLHRVHSDFHLLNVLNFISRPLNKFKPWKFTKLQQWIVTAIAVILAGAPFTPFSEYLDHWLEELLPTHPYAAAALMIAHFTISVCIIRVLFLNVLHARRFRKLPTKSLPPAANK